MPGHAEQQYGAGGTPYGIPAQRPERNWLEQIGYDIQNMFRGGPPQNEGPVAPQYPPQDQHGSSPTGPPRPGGFDPWVQPGSARSGGAALKPAGPYDSTDPRGPQAAVLLPQAPGSQTERPDQVMPNGPRTIGAYAAPQSQVLQGTARSLKAPTNRNADSWDSVASDSQVDSLSPPSAKYGDQYSMGYDPYQFNL